MNRTISLILFLVLLATAPVTAQWKQTSGPEGGEIFALAATENGALATIYPNRLYSFNGTTWNRLNDLRIMKLWSAGDDIYYATTLDEGLIRSEDDGKSWTVTGVNGDVVEFADNSESGMLYASSGRTLFATSNNGVSWDSVAIFDSMTISAIAASGETIVISAHTTSSASVVNFSTDGGETWFTTDSGLPANNSVLALSAADENTIHMGTAQNGVYHSTDRGATWNPLGTLPPDNVGNATATDVAVIDGIVWAATPQGIYRFGETTWHLATAHPGRILSPVPDLSGSTMVMGTDAGILASDPLGDTVRNVSFGLRAARVNTFYGTESGMLAATPFGLYTTADDGGVWSRLSPIEVEEFSRIGATIFARTAPFRAAGVWRSNDDGRSWEPTMENFPESLTELTAIAANSNALFATFGDVFSLVGGGTWVTGGVYRSTDRGESWEAVNNGLPLSDGVVVPVGDIAVDGPNLVIITADGLYRSTNNGDNWKLTGPTLENGLFPVIEANFNEFYFGVENMIFHSTDAGETWETLPIGISPEFDINSISFINNVAIVAAERPSWVGDATSMLFRRSATGWVDISKGIPEGVTFTRFAPRGGTIFGGTQNSSVYTASIDDILGSPSSVDGRSTTGGRIAASATPNPFSTGTSISFRLERAGASRLVVTNQLGEVVATPVDGYLPSGDHTIALDGTTLPSGILYYRLETNGKTSIGKIVKIR